MVWLGRIAGTLWSIWAVIIEDHRPLNTCHESEEGEGDERGWAVLFEVQSALSGLYTCT